MEGILQISQRLFTFRRDSSHLERILRMSEFLHISQRLFTFRRDSSLITGRPISPFQYHWSQPPFQWVPGKGGQSLKRNIQLYIAPRSTLRIIVLSHSEVVLWLGNYCLSCTSPSMRRRYLHTFLTLALNV